MRPGDLPVTVAGIFLAAAALYLMLHVLVALITGPTLEEDGSARGGYCQTGRECDS